MYIRTTDLTLHTEQDIREAYPNVAFPHPFVAPAGYAWVFPTPQPQYDPLTQKAVSGPPELTAAGKYQATWTVVDLPAEVAAANVAESNRVKNSGTLAQIAALDLKRIRPLAEGDTEYLQTITDQIKTLRAQLIK